MKTMTMRVAIGMLVAIGLGLGPASVIDPDGAEPATATLVIVELVSGADIDDVVADYGLTLVTAVEQLDFYLVSFPPSYSEDDIEAIEDDPRVHKVSLDFDAQTPEAAGGDTQPIFFYVAPVVYYSQYATSLIGSGIAQQTVTGDGVVIAVLDTGIDAGHELFAGRIVPGGYNFVGGNTNIADVGTGLDADNDGLADELAGHGTFVAGIIATVAPGASILPIKVLDSEGYSSVFRIVVGIYYAMAQGADVINLSLGTKNHNHILRDAVEDAHAAGIIVVTAVGNEDREHPAQVPAGEDTTLAIASTDAGDLKCDFSNYGEHVTLTAPGADVTSAMPGGLYAQSNGTSSSTAFVSGAVALLLSINPDASPEQVETWLRSTALDLESANPDYCGLLGSGRLNVAAAVALAGPQTPGPVPDWAAGELPPAFMGLPFAGDVLILLGEQ